MPRLRNSSHERFIPMSASGLAKGIDFLRLLLWAIYIAPVYSSFFISDVGPIRTRFITVFGAA